MSVVIVEGPSLIIYPLKIISRFTVESNPSSVGTVEGLSVELEPWYAQENSELE